MHGNMSLKKWLLVLNIYIFSSFTSPTTLWRFLSSDFLILFDSLPFCHHMEYVQLTFFTRSTQVAPPFLLANFYFCHSIISGSLCEPLSLSISLQNCLSYATHNVFSKLVLRGIFTINLFIIINFLFAQDFLVLFLLFSGQRSLSVQKLSNVGLLGTAPLLKTSYFSEWDAKNFERSLRVLVDNRITVFLLNTEEKYRGNRIL